MDYLKIVMGCLLGYVLSMLFGLVMGVDLAEWFNGRVLFLMLYIASPFILFFGTVWTILFVVKKVWTSIE